MQVLVHNLYSKQMKRFYTGLLLIITFASCRPEFETPRYDSGDADFTRFVAVGSSQMAGYNDGALTLTGQENSIAAILANRLALAGGGNFKQPYVNSGYGFGVVVTEAQGVSQFDFTGKLELQNTTNCLQQSDVKTYVTPHNPADRNWIGNQGPFNNLAVPNIKSFQMYSQQLGRSGSTGNPYYARFASDTGATTGLSSTILEEAVRQNPTFFALWIGNNDVFSYGFSGGSGSVSGLGPYDITPVDTFSNAIDNIVNGLTGNRAKGVIGNLPDLTSLPFYTVIPWNGLNLTAQEAAALTLQWSNFGFVFNEGPNGFIYVAGSGLKQMGPGELVTLKVSLDSIRCYSMGEPSTPLRADCVLDSSEVSTVRSRISTFNSKLQSVAQTKNLAFADLNAFYKTLQSGIVFNGNNYSIEYLTGSMFSIDGIYPTSRGYALIANVFIDAINTRYKSNLSPADANAYPGVKLP
jgi:hypothetical protein